MAVGAPGVACAGDSLAVAALSVLADEKAGILAVDRQQAFPAAGAFGIGQVVMAEGSVGGLDLFNQLLGVMGDFPDKFGIFSGAFCNLGEPGLPGGCKLRLF